MSPFALYLRKLRLHRSYKQKELADLLGYEASYISALERDEKGPPKQDFVDRLIKGLTLTEEEQAALSEVLRLSRRHISLPHKASAQEYTLIHQLEPQLGQLHPIQIQLIELALQIPSLQNHPA